MSLMWTGRWTWMRSLVLRSRSEQNRSLEKTVMANAEVTGGKAAETVEASETTEEAATEANAVLDLLVDEQSRLVATHVLGKQAFISSFQGPQAVLSITTQERINPEALDKTIAFDAV